MPATRASWRLYECATWQQCRDLRRALTAAAYSCRLKNHSRTAFRTTAPPAVVTMLAAELDVRIVVTIPS